MGLPLSGLAQNVRQVQVTEVKGRVEIHVIGTNLPKPVDVASNKDLAYTLEWQAGLQIPSRRVSIGSGDVKAVWYGRYASMPQRMVVKILANKALDPECRPEADGWMITLKSKPNLAKKAAVSSQSLNRGLLAMLLQDHRSPMQNVKVDSQRENSDEFSLVEHVHDRVALSEPVDVSAPKVSSKPAIDMATPVVEMSPVLKHWATLEQMDKRQVKRSAPMPIVHPELPRAITGAVPIDVAPRGQYRRVTLDCSNAELAEVLKGLALQSGANIVIGPGVVGKVTADLHDVTIEQALKYVSYLTGMKYEINDGIYMFGVMQSALPDMSKRVPTDFTKAVFIRSEQESKIMLLLTSQFSLGGLVVLSSEKSEFKVSEQNKDSGAGSGQESSSNVSLTNSTEAVGRHFLLLLGPEAVVDAAAEMATSIDRELMRGYEEEQVSEELVSYDVKFADPRALREALISQVQGLRAVIAPNSVGTFEDYKEGKTKSQSVEQLRQEDLASTNGGTNAPAAVQGSVGSVNTTSVDDASLEAPFSKEESVSMPMRLVLRGTRAQIREALDYVKVLDTPPKQVALELRVMELTKTDALNAGIDWSILTGGAVKMINLNNSQPTPNNTASIGISGKGFNADVTASLDALAEKNKMVARPNMVAMDGRQSEVFVGDIVRYVESITQSQNGTTVTTGEIPVGVRLSVLPRIGADGNMTLDLRPRISILTGFTNVPGGGELPQTSSRFAQSTISLHSGQTIAIGGLIQDQDVKTFSGIPVLMNLPLIGNLFKSTTINKERTELVIFLTAKSLNGPVGWDALPMQKDLKYGAEVVGQK
jgi:type II secretory pathway component GspD/PulD (secretin)